MVPLLLDVPAGRTAVLAVELEGETKEGLVLKVANKTWLAITCFKYCFYTVKGFLVNDRRTRRRCWSGFSVTEVSSDAMLGNICFLARVAFRYDISLHFHAE